MQVPFKVGQVVILTDNNSKEKTTYSIAGVCGFGASCIVYDAVKEDKRRVRIKEYFPVLPSCVRNEKLDVVPEENTGDFYNGLERFRKSYHLQQELRRDARLTNSIIPAEAYCRGYGTEYIVTTDMSGESFDKKPAESLEELLQILSAVTKVLEIYHEKGVLHLDLKPANIFRIPETNEHVMLFDFDSAVKMAELEQGEGILSCSPKWAAPEQKRGTGNSFCPATDFYAVGAIVFDYLFHRDITSSDRECFCEWDFDEADRHILENLDPAIFEKLTEFFHRTLAANIKRRFSSSRELEAFMGDLLKLANPERKYIMSRIPSPNGCFVGREAELEQVHERLRSNSVLCLCGIGGIGKSEFMKQYALRYKREYGSIIFAPYIDNMESTFCDDEIFPIYHFVRQEKEDFPAYYKRKMRKFKSLIDAGNKDTLVIIDNLTDFEDAGVGELVSPGCKIVITSRVDGFEYGINTMKLDCIADMSSIRMLFNSYYGKIISGDEWDRVDAIIELVNRHTLAVELLAKQMQAGRISIDTMLEKLRRRGLSDTGKDRIALNKNNETRKDSAYELIRSIFDMSGLLENELYILRNLTFFTYSGIHTKCFVRWCALENYDDVNDLVVKGWINLDTETDHIAIHPVISAVVGGAAGGDTAWMEPLLRNSLKEYNESDYDEEYADEVLRNLSCIERQLTDGDYNSLSAAYFLKKASFTLEAAGDYRSYKRALEKALDIYIKTSGGENEAVSEIYVNLGRLSIINDPEEAEKYLQKAFVLCEGHGSDGNFVEVMKLSADLYPLRAGYFYRRAIECCHDNEEIGELYIKWGNHYKRTHHFRKARQCYEKAFVHLESCSFDAFRYLHLLIGYWSIPFVRLEEEMSADAEQILKHLIDFAEQRGRDGEILFLISSCLLASEFYGTDKRNSELAEEYGRKALNLCLKIEEDEGDTAMLTGQLCRMGMLYKKAGKLEEAEEMIRQSLAYLDKNDSGRLTGYGRLFSINMRKKNFRMSKQYFLMLLEGLKESFLRGFKQGLEGTRKRSE